MSSGSIRIIQLPEKSSVNTDDYMAVDSSANGTKKVKFTDLLDDNLSAQNKAADAQATGQAISELNTDINNTNTRIDNMINTQQNAEVTTLWTGTLNTIGGSVTLSKSVSNFDFLDFYTSNGTFERVPVSAGTLKICETNIDDNGLSAFQQTGEATITFSGTTVTLTSAYIWDYASTGTVTISSGIVSNIKRIDGVKIGHIENDEIVDARVGANGTTYPTLGDAIRGQVTDLKADSSIIADVLSISLEEFADGSFVEFDATNIGMHLYGSTQIHSRFMPIIIGSKISFELTDNTYQFNIVADGVSVTSWGTGEQEYTPTDSVELYLRFRKPDSSALNSSDIATIASAFSIKYYPKNIYSKTDELSNNLDDIADNTLIYFKNLLDDTTLVSGGYYSSTGSITSKSGSNYSTQKIPVEAGKTYTLLDMTGSVYLACGKYNSSGVPSFVRRTALSGMTYTCPNDVNYICVSLYNGSFGDNAMVVEGTVEPPEYLEYNEQIIRVKRNSIFPEVDENKRCKVIHKNGGFSDFTSAYVDEYLAIYIPMANGYYEQSLGHCVYASRFADNWKLSIGYKTDDALQRLYNVIINGEFELAVAMPQKGYVGGIAHGYEKTDSNGLTIFVDGKKTSLASLNTMATFDTLNIIEQSTLYDPDDTATEIAKHTREYIITKEKIRIVQALKWLIDTSITRCFMAMMPIAKVDNTDSSIVITDKYFSDMNAIPQSVIPNEEQYIADARRVTLYSEDNNAYASLNLVEYPDNYVGGNTAFITDNNGGNYNKLYFQISSSDGGNSVTTGTIWKSITEYEFKC